MSIKKTKNADIRLGKKDRLKDSDFNSKDIRHRISIVIPEDVLMKFRKMAKEVGLGYQTLINQVLRDAAFPGPSTDLRKRIKRLEKRLFG